MNWRGRFTASSCRAVEGDHHGAPADLVVLCAFSLFNVHLMLLSGIGKPYDPVADVGAVGRNYSYQNLNRVTLFFDDSVQANGFIGIGGGGTTFDDLNGNQLDSAKAGFVGGGVIWARQPGSGPIRGIATAPGRAELGQRLEAGRQGCVSAFVLLRSARRLHVVSLQLPGSGPDLPRRFRPAAAAHERRMPPHRWAGKPEGVAENGGEFHGAVR